MIMLEPATVLVFTALGIVTTYLSLKKEIEKLKLNRGNEPYMTVDVFTWQTEDGTPTGNIAADKDGKKIPVLVKRNFKLKVPVLVNIDDPHIYAPFITIGKSLWLFHSMTQKDEDKGFNLFVLYAGKNTPDQPILADAENMEERDYDSFNEDGTLIQMKPDEN